MRTLKLFLVIVSISLISISLLSVSSCKKGEDDEEPIVEGEGRYEDFLFIETVPAVQENDVLDIEIRFQLDWDNALNNLGIIERENTDEDLWVTLNLTRLEFLDDSGELVQVINFSKQSIASLNLLASNNDANPQIFNQIKYYDGGFTENYGRPTVRPAEMTAAIHFLIVEELGHLTGTVKIYGFIEIPEHYESKEGKEGIYELKPGKQFEAGLIREVVVDASGLPKVPNYSKSDKTIGDTSSGGDAIETVTVIADALRMRESPSLDSDVVTILDKGTQLDVLEKNESWYKVRTPDGQIGWARAYYEGDIYLD
jgi:hypothetical protein